MTESCRKIFWSRWREETFILHLFDVTSTPTLSLYKCILYKIQGNTQSIYSERHFSVNVSLVISVYTWILWYVPLCACLDTEKVAESYSVRLHHHQSFSITSIHVTAILHQSLAELPHPLHLSRPHCCCCCCFFFSSLSGSLTLSLTHCERIDSQSTLTKWKQAANFCLHGAERAHNQAKRRVAKAEERWEFALSVKSQWDNAAESLQVHKCAYNRETNLSELAFTPISHTVKSSYRFKCSGWSVCSPCE